MAEERQYWSSRRLPRRSALIALGAGAAAAGVAACGGAKNNGSASKGTGGGGTIAAGTAAAPAQSGTAVTKQPKPGGTLTFQLPTPPPSLDPYTQTSFLCSYMNGLAYSKLYRSRAGG